MAVLNDRSQTFGADRTLPRDPNAKGRKFRKSRSQSSYRPPAKSSDLKISTKDLLQQVVPWGIGLIAASVLMVWLLS